MGIKTRPPHLCWSEGKCYEVIRILEVMKDILSPDHSSFVKTC